MKHINKLFTLGIALFAAASVSAQTTKHRVEVESNRLRTFEPSTLNNVVVGDSIIFLAIGNGEQDRVTLVGTVPNGAPSVNIAITPDQADSTFRYKVIAPGGYTFNINGTGFGDLKFSAVPAPVTSVENGVAYEGISFFPNPVKSEVNITLNPSFDYTVSVNNLAGASMVSQSVSGANATTLNVDALPKGSYVLMVTNSNSGAKAFKFVKE